MALRWPCEPLIESDASARVEVFNFLSAAEPRKRELEEDSGSERRLATNIDLFFYSDLLKACRFCSVFVYVRPCERSGRCRIDRRGQIGGPAYR
jgi:hypothetical protein